MIRFGVIGTNWITDRWIEAGREQPDFTLAAVCSRTEERAREFAAKHGAAHAYADPDALAASGTVDAVYIATPNSSHADIAVRLLRRGIAVLCEKPLASNEREAAAMIEAARASGALLMEAVKTTLMPNFEAVRDSLGKIGPIRRYFASYCQYSSRYDAYRAGTVLNAFNPALSNGGLLDLGIYCLYPALVLFGEPKQVKANGVLLASGVDGEGSLLLEYEGMEAVALYSKITDSAMPSEIQGEDGCIVIDRIGEPGRVTIRYRDGSEEDVSRPQSARTMTYEIREFLDLLAAGRTESAVNSWDRSLAAARIMDEARRQIGLVYPADTRSGEERSIV